MRARMKDEAPASAIASFREGGTGLLFAYGTLIPGMEPPVMSAVVRRLTVVGPATIKGRLYDLGSYPGVVLDSKPGLVRGHLLRVPSDRLWHALDAYEGCDPPENLFRRVKTAAVCEDGRQVDCWVYVFNRDPTAAREVQCGCWMTHRSKRTL